MFYFIDLSTILILVSFNLTAIIILMMNEINKINEKDSSHLKQEHT